MNRRDAGIALFMSLLVILLPIYSANVMAVSSGTVKNVKVVGKDNIDGITRVQDSLTITAEVEVGNDAAITTDQVLFNNVPFTTCTALTGGFSKCTYQGVTQIVPGGQQGFLIQLQDDDGELVTTKTGSYVRDDSAPVVNSVSFDKTKVSGGDVSVTLDVQDVAQSSVSSSVCAGLASIAIYADGISAGTIPIANYPCTYKKTITRSASSFGTKTGKKEVCFGGLDRFSQETDAKLRKCVEFTYDPTGLQINTNSLLAYQGTKLVEYVRTGVAVSGLTFVINITDPDGSAVSASNVEADFSGVGGPTQRRASSCNSVGINIYACSFFRCKHLSEKRCYRYCENYCQRRCG